MPADFSALQAEVDRQTTINASAIALINGFHAQLQAAIDADNLADNSNVAQFAATVKANTDALASAVEANVTPTP